MLPGERGGGKIRKFHDNFFTVTPTFRGPSPANCLPKDFNLLYSGNKHYYQVSARNRVSNSTPGPADLCFITAIPIPDEIERLGVNGVEILEGPAQRTGVAGTIKSVYFRDPDGNLVEISNYENA